MVRLDFSLKSSALLVMDCQYTIVNRLTPEDKARVLSNTEKSISAARRAGLRVIYLVVQFRPGYPEISERNLQFSQTKSSGTLNEIDAGTRICNELRPMPEDVIVVKRRISAFTGSDLEVVLRSQKIDTLFLAGVSTLGVIESTARQAFDMDYRVFVIRDCCADREPDLSQIALDRLLPRVSRVCTLDDFMASLVTDKPA